MNVLVVNCGSSSVKCAMFVDGVRVASGTAELGGERTALRFEAADGTAAEEERGHLDHAAAAVEVARWLAGRGSVPDAVAHRVVHGGSEFQRSVVIDEERLAALEKLRRLAPLHNGPALSALRALREELGAQVPVTASFDTAFHRMMPERASRYAIPLDLADRHGLRRFGFHGLAHEAMARGAGRLLGQPLEELRLITLQLGSGCSAAAIRGGRSIDTSMGLTPLEGLMMGTRSGDADPSLATEIASAEGIEPAAAVELLNERSGLLGVSGRSADVRDVLAAERAGDERAALAIEMFCYRIRKQVGAYLAALEGADAVVFGGGIGEHSAEMRARVSEPLAWAGLQLDAGRNEGSGAASDGGLISSDDSALRALVVPSDEEALIAAECEKLLGPSAGAGQ